VAAVIRYCALDSVHGPFIVRSVQSPNEERPMAVRYQLVIDCTDPDLLARFWAAALGYELEPPPAGFDTWDDWRRDIGLAVGQLNGDGFLDPLDYNGFINAFEAGC